MAHTQTNASGDYALAVGAGSYKVQFFEFPLPAVHPHIGQWWDHKPFDQGADLLVVAGDRQRVDAAPPPAVFICGNLTPPGGATPLGRPKLTAPGATAACSPP